jgi:hypothetical protein
MDETEKELEIPENKELHQLLKALEEENFHLKRQLKNKNREIKSKVKSIKRMKKKLQEFEGEKQFYRNKPRGNKSKN